jgi:hypothetical protein
MFDQSNGYVLAMKAKDAQRSFHPYLPVGVSNPCDGLGSVTRDVSSQSVTKLETPTVNQFAASISQTFCYKTQVLCSGT